MPRTVNLEYLINALIRYDASDLHLRVGRPPLFRVTGSLIPSKLSDLSDSDVYNLIKQTLSEKLKQNLLRYRQIDYSFSLLNQGRFRCNVYFEKGKLAAAIRKIPFEIPDLGTLGVPEVARELIEKARGLLLITGATGSGKSTTLASLVQLINSQRRAHILCIEDPIEFIFMDRKSVISQREVGSDVLSVPSAILAGLRQDPDVIVIGEMRDAETIRAALSAAEMGHLVISTLHSNDTTSALSRILNSFPPESRDQLGVQLASGLVGIITQQLVAEQQTNLTKSHVGRVLACEVLVKSPLIRDLILRKEFERISEAIEKSEHYYKMQSMDQSLERLVREKRISPQQALHSSHSPDNLRLKMAGVDREEGFTDR